MAYATVLLEKEVNGKTIKREAPLGFSWTMFFLAPFPALFRKDWAFFFTFVLIFTAVCLIIVFFLSDSQSEGIPRYFGLLLNMSLGIGYNKFYISKLLKMGFVAKDVLGNNIDGKDSVDRLRSVAEKEKLDFFATRFSAENLEKIARIKELLDQNAITGEEFAAMKKSILG